MGLSRHGLCALFGLTCFIGWDNNFILGSETCSRLGLSSGIMVFKCYCLLNNNNTKETEVTSFSICRSSRHPKEVTYGFWPDTAELVWR